MANTTNRYTIKEDTDKSTLQSEMTREIISRKPGFFEKWALAIFSIILLLLLTASWLIKYPDVVTAKATITTGNAPKEIVIKEEGRIVKLFAQNDQLVKKGAVLGWMESTANHAEVLSLSMLLDSSINLSDPGQIKNLSSLFSLGYTNLGEIQQGYREFITSLQLFNDYMTNGFYSNKRVMLEDDVKTLDKTRLTILHQKELTQQDIRLSEDRLKMQKALLDQKVISRDEFHTEESRLYNKQISIPQIDASLLSNETQKREKEKELSQLDHDMAQQQLIFRQALQSLKSLIDDWKKKYVIQSPLNGKVFFIIPIQENQFLPQTKLIGYVNPDDRYFYAEANLPQANFGKVDTGLKVQLRFDAYPFQEYGVVNGTLNYISNIPSDSGFLATIRLNNKLKTNNNKEIPYKTGLKAEAVIITQNMRLLERFYYDIIRATSRK
ncbi:HlyD family secretion protein [Filimonas lacunae]|uniref:HlyD family secretion protein n=1 Tax=Filimonas lacunae TaxID=477680 RepID=A0A173MAB4_9BACT|nr:HlyD family efflux transporter periplasmic adaptor subunit [Filimonas lacunae]BAV04398.1 hemolysin secretion protein [Filimonas lacunae]SIT31289.1 HlyD family secretion protein [Filimonas lacunae]